MNRALLLILAGLPLALPGAAVAQPAAAEDNIRYVTVYGADPCPPSTADEITVCARRPDNERYRIPEDLRTTPGPESESWASRSQALEYVGAAGPQSCSPVGPGGASGCLEQMINNAREERRQQQEGAPQPD